VQNGQSVQYARRKARKICREVEKRTYALTAVTLAVQDRLAEDVILEPRAERWSEAVVYTVETYHSQGGRLRQHFVCYWMPDPEGEERPAEELLKVVLDVGHELAHLVLDRLPVQSYQGLGLTKRDREKIEEVEADWFALCLLQMYGFVFPHR